MASHSAHNLKLELGKVLAESRILAGHVGQLIELTTDYEMIRQLKKIDAELLDVQHNISIALEMEA